MTPSRIALIAVAGAVAASAAAAQDKGAVPAQFAATGETADCIDPAQIADSRILDERHLLFEMKGGPQYLNRLDGPCPGLLVERSYTYSLPTRRLCKEDVISVLRAETGATRASCGLGPFRAVEPARGDNGGDSVPPHRGGG